MTVADLISSLQQQDPQAVVVIVDPSASHWIAELGIGELQSVQLQLNEDPQRAWLSIEDDGPLPGLFLGRAMNIDAKYLELFIAVDLAELLEKERGQRRVARYLYAEIHTACKDRAVAAMRDAIADLERPPTKFFASKARNAKQCDADF